jgi:hypothetical protein
MPDVAFLLYSLGLARDARAIPIWERVAGLLDPREEDFRDRYKGTFYYVDAIAFGAERLADPAAIPILERLRAFPTIRDQASRVGFQPDIFAERRALLEVAVARALARCGDARGYEVLIDYLDDNRALLADGADDELSDITGQRFGKDAARWRAWLAGARDSLRPCPYTASLDLPAEGEVILRRAI